MTEKEKLEEAKMLYKTANADQRYVLESLFPELAESEDERIRKQILNYFVAQKVNEPQPVLDSWIAWLEKQSKQKWSEEDSLMIDSIIDTIKWLEGKGATNMKIDWLQSLKQRMEKQE